MRALLGFLVAAVTIAAAGCGGGDAEPRRVALPPGPATELAAQSDAIAASLEGGDPCAAAARVELLRQTAETEIRGGRVPRPYRARIRRGIERMAGGITCVPPPPPTSYGRGDGDGDDDEDDEEHEEEDDD